jgi:hypothetical protein
MNRVVAVAATFAVVLGVVLGGAALAPVVLGDTSQSTPEIDDSHYTDEDLLTDGTPGNADVTMDADVEPQTVVIDPGIEQRPQRPGARPLLFGSLGPETTERDILPLVNVLVENGHDVRIHSPGGGQERPQRPSRPGGAPGEELSSLGEELADADAFVTFRTDYSDDELDDIGTFAEADGRVLVATEPGDVFEEPGGAGLRSTVGAATGAGYVYNLAENDLNYQRIFAEPAGGSGLTDGVERAVFPTASPVSLTDTADSELRPIDGSRLSTTRSATDAPVLARSGDVVAVGDTDFLVPENAQRADNDDLIGNLAEFLVTNDRDPGEQPPEPPETETPRGPPGTGPAPPGAPNGTERPPGSTPPEPTPQEPTPAAGAVTG